MSEFMKSLVGKEVITWPIGNSVPRQVKVTHSTAIIVKVARVFTTIRFSNNREEKMRHRGSYLSNGFNGGCRVFENLQALEDSQLSNKLRVKIAQFFRDRGYTEVLNLDQLKQIAEIIEVEDEENG